MIGAAAGEVDAVVVTFNSEAVIGRCLASLPPSMAVTIVDNGSRDDTLAVARAARPDVRVLTTPRNIGYGAAANLGFTGGKAPYAILINPDAVLADGAIAALVGGGRALSRCRAARAMQPRSERPYRVPSADRACPVPDQSPRRANASRRAIVAPRMSAVR